ncbi:hypothetical protein LX32DRAFT_62341 [Colletotrichum zoysiae]|uniref:Uncharacterized protein n=1 Tax=Colletotrichum zoysiae TaxID=1216348 RepID=A0AAD9HBQ0_9PEZI|nr:hypothetical protein LX32DRAFT_62341 [Colletotrichum zoysiae]
MIEKFQLFIMGARRVTKSSKKIISTYRMSVFSANLFGAKQQRRGGQQVFLLWAHMGNIKRAVAGKDMRCYCFAANLSKALETGSGKYLTGKGGVGYEFCLGVVRSAGEPLHCFVACIVGLERCGREHARSSSVFFFWIPCASSLLFHHSKMDYSLLCGGGGITLSGALFSRASRESCVIFCWEAG